MVRLRLIGHIAELIGAREKHKAGWAGKVRTYIKAPEGIISGECDYNSEGMPASLNRMIKDEDYVVVMPMVGGG